MNKFERVIDANCNRTREGLRVLEEIARFMLDDENLFNNLKNLRHEFTDTEKYLRKNGSILSRDTSADVGKEYIEHLESRRKNIIDIVKANSKRVEESLRVLEEFLKITDCKYIKQIKQIRFKTYSIENELAEKLSKQ
ncbi:thiamine-phosphate pyrophosphorylase [bacterium]|nr:thiamine-phosphate pyrophosphorylase [bacterium]